MDFHLQRAVARKILHVRFKDTRHAHFLSRTHIVVIEHQRRFLQRSVRIGIAFRLRIRRLVILVRIFTVVNRLYGNVVRVLRRHIFGHHRFDAVHFHNLRMFRRRSLVQVGHRRFFPSVSYDGKMHHLHLRLGHAIIQLAQPEPAELRLRKNRLVIICRRRDNRIVLVQRNAPLSPSVLKDIEMGRVRIRQIDAVTHEADILVQGAVLVDVFGIVGAFARVLFGSVDSPGRIAFFIQVVVKIIVSDIVRRRIYIAHPHAIFSALTRIGSAIPNRVDFVRSTYAIKALVIERRRCPQVIFAVVIPVRRSSVNREVFANKTQVQVERTHVSARHHFDILHIAHILVVTTVRTHHATPGITSQVVVRAERHLEYRQVLIVNIGISD